MPPRKGQSQGAGAKGFPQGHVASRMVSSSCPNRAWYSAKWPWLVRSAMRACSLFLGIHSSGRLVSSFVS